MQDSLDLRNVLTKDHSQKWVALSRDYKKVIDYSDDLIELRKKIGVADVVYIKVPESGRHYAF